MVSEGQLVEAATTVLIVVAAHLRQTQLLGRRHDATQMELRRCARRLAILEDRVKRQAAPE